MGIYINKGNEGFRSSRNSEYVDKSGLISVVNSTLFTRQRFTCVSRCRRFGKSMAAEMLAAYYDHSCDSRSLFADLKIAGDPSFEKHLNKYPVICLDLSDFVTRYKDDNIVDKMEERMVADILKYPHHGVNPVEMTFMNAVKPKLSIITNKARNTPAQEGLIWRGYPFINTRYGGLVCATDGNCWLIDRLISGWRID